MVRMIDIIAYMVAGATLLLGIPIGVSIERIRIYRKAKKRCPEALEMMHDARIL